MGDWISDSENILLVSDDEVDILRAILKEACARALTGDRVGRSDYALIEGLYKMLEDK